MTKDFVFSSQDPTPASGVTLGRPQLAHPTIFTLSLNSVSVTVDSGDDFGSAEICTLPNTGIILLGAVTDLSVSVADIDTAQVDAVDFAVGTVATTSTTFANAGEKNLMPKIDGVGAAETGTAKGGLTSAVAPVSVTPGAANKVYLNLSTPVTAGTGSVTVTGTVKLVLIDVGVPA